MSREFQVDAGAAVTAWVNYQIELDWDYAYLIYSTDGGASWANLETNLSTADDPNNQNLGSGITGSSGGWTELTAALPGDVSGTILLGFRYWTDLYTVGLGFMVDEISVEGSPTDGGETELPWVYDGFRRTTGSEDAYYANYYVAEYRHYWGYDNSLKYAYNFGFLDDPALFNYVERFPYQDGLLISYWDTSFYNNDVGAHCAAGRCGGMLLPIDAHPEVMIRPDGGVWRNRIQSHDSTFGLEPTDGLTLHWGSVESIHPSLPAAPVFDDNLSYWRADNPMGSVITPHTGTQIRVEMPLPGGFMQVKVRPTP